MITIALNREMSLEFDLLWNNLASDKAPGVETYEKSVFLTHAQELLITDIFSGKTDPYGNGYDGSERRQADFRMLTDTTAPATVSGAVSGIGVKSGALHYKYPNNALLLLDEELVVSGKYYSIAPISYVEYARLQKRPYKFPPKGVAWRLLTHVGTESGEDYSIMTIIGNFPETRTGVSYQVRYVKRPEPIILESLEGTQLYIEGVQAEQACKLPKQLHKELIRRAVLLAKMAWQDPTSYDKDKKEN